MKSRLEFAGHPVHAMLVGVPIGLYSAALVCDGLYLLLHEPFWFRMAYWALVFGLAGHLGAAATGMPDFLAVMRDKTEARRPAASHLIFGLGLLVVQVLNLAVRNGGDVPVGVSVGVPVIMNVIGATLTGIQGWYGGELVFRHRIGVDVPEPPTEPAHGKHKDHKASNKPYHY